MKAPIFLREGGGFSCVRIQDWYVPLYIDPPKGATKGLEIHRRGLYLPRSVPYTTNRSSPKSAPTLGCKRIHTVVFRSVKSLTQWLIVNHTHESTTSAPTLGKVPHPLALKQGKGLEKGPLFKPPKPD